MPEARRDAEWRRLLRTRRWRRTRAAQLQAQPLCERCLPKIVPATVVHHVNRARDNIASFFDGPFASLCKPCHDAIEQGIEARGYDKTIGDDGWPIDDAHPANRWGGVKKSEGFRAATESERTVARNASSPS